MQKTIIPATIENITTLMINDVNSDKHSLRSKVEESLDRLMKQNYVHCGRQCL